MFPKVLALLEAIHVGLNSARAAYEEALSDSESAKPVEQVVDMTTLVKEMNDRMLTQLLQSRAQIIQKKLDLN